MVRAVVGTLLEVGRGKRSVEDFAALVLPPDSARLFLAASAADVFGGMGSWNDSPPWYAHDLGREEEYNQLSHELFVQSRNAVVYAVNY